MNLHLKRQNQGITFCFQKKNGLNYTLIKEKVTSILTHKIPYD